MLDTGVAHLEDLAKYILLHCGHVDTSATAAKLHAVDNEVVVVGPGPEGVGSEEVKIFGCEGCREWVVGGGEAGGTALARVGRGSVCGHEHGESSYPEELEGAVKGEEIMGDGLLIDMVTEGAEGSRPSREGLVGTGLDDKEVTFFKLAQMRELGSIRAKEPLCCLMAEGRQT